MDSLHPSLSQALPLRDYDAEKALQAPFRAAALGIATFYKKSAENGRKAYTLGYSSALQDVLTHLQTALDQPDSQHSQQSMALTIGRVIDYIQRRQEALRAESQEPSEEDAAHPSPTPQHRQNQLNAAPPSQASPSPTENQNRSNHHHSPSRESTNLSLPLDSGPQTTQSIRRRTSPRRMTPITFQNSSEEAVSNDSSYDPTPQPHPSPSMTTSTLPQPINVTFSSFAASPLPQHQQPSVISTSHFTSRRHRGVTTDGTRKGKVRERALGVDRSATGTPLDPTGLIPRGYSHYNSNNSSSSSSEVKTLSSLGNKRRFPVESILSIHDSNPSTPSPPPPSMRISRRSNPSKPLPLPSVEPAESTTTSASNPEGSIQIRNSDDAVMILQGGDSDQDAKERPSKRFLFL